MSNAPLKHRTTRREERTHAHARKMELKDKQWVIMPGGQKEVERQGVVRLWDK